MGFTTEIHKEKARRYTKFVWLSEVEAPQKDLTKFLFLADFAEIRKQCPAERSRSPRKVIQQTWASTSLSRTITNVSGVSNNKCVSLAPIEVKILLCRPDSYREAQKIVTNSGISS